MFLFSAYFSNYKPDITHKKGKGSKSKLANRQPLYSPPEPLETDSDEEEDIEGYKAWGIPKDPLSANWGFAGLGSMASPQPLSTTKSIVTSTVRQIHAMKFQLNINL